MIIRAFRYPHEHGDQGWSRVDLVMTLVGVLLLLGLVLPALARSGSGSDRLVCFNNLRLVGRALQIWGNERTGAVTWRTDVRDGGTMPGSPTGVAPKLGNVWYELAWASNELATPKILACPSDVETRVARDFSGDPAGGLLHYNYRANAISYFLGLDAFPSDPSAVVAGDRNMKVTGTGTGCSSGIQNAALVVNAPPSNIPVQTGWTNGLHGEVGHLLGFDGRVDLVPSDRIRLEVVNINGSTHLLFPR